MESRKEGGGLDKHQFDLPGFGMVTAFLLLKGRLQAARWY